jgi:ubiquinone/menaquinone biosynthesis C-methylase UbiE
MSKNTQAEASDKTYDSWLRRSYDAESARYDSRRYESSEGQYFNDLEISVLRSWLPLERGRRILDLPAGTGRLSVPLSEQGALVVGGDVSEGMLRANVAKARQLGTRATPVQASGTTLPFADDTFDAVVSFKFFHLIPNDTKLSFTREMARVLKPGGMLVAEFNSPYYGGVLAFLRYYFKKRHPGGMRMKCLFPDQVHDLFPGLTVTRTLGVKLPFTGILQPVIGRRATDAFNLWFGRIPGLKYFTYAIMVEARKPLR